jgi:hypothetical protein
MGVSLLYIDCFFTSTWTNSIQKVAKASPEADHDEFMFYFYSDILMVVRMPL